MTDLQSSIDYALSLMIEAGSINDRVKENYFSASMWVRVFKSTGKNTQDDNLLDRVGGKLVDSYDHFFGNSIAMALNYTDGHNDLAENANVVVKCGVDIGNHFIPAVKDLRAAFNTSSEIRDNEKDLAERIKAALDEMIDKSNKIVAATEKVREHLGIGGQGSGRGR